MATATIKYYPVCNGDCSLLTLTDNTTIMVDCNIRESSKGDSDETQFDVKADLLQSIQRRESKPFVDVFVLTHGDKDHCLGYTKNFYQGDPLKYDKTNLEAQEIIMDEIWFSPMIQEIHSNDEEDNVQQEVMRRVALHLKGDPNSNKPGNRILIIGYDGNDSFQKLNHLRKIPGNIITSFNQKEQTLFSVFLHAPFKEQLYDEEKTKNSASIVFQARFKQSPADTNFSCLAMFGGDADHYSWCIIQTKTEQSNNHINQQALNWDLFLAPHHCSWTYFNDCPQKDNPTPKDSSLAILDYKRLNAKVIASSKAILDNDDNPPHHQAKKQYVNKVGSVKFLNTETHIVKKKTPQPIVFEVTAQGPVPPKITEGSAIGAGAAGLGAINKVSGYGAR
ncbi:cobyric acid synthase CobQ [Hymenobacter sp. BT186]|uniref:Cobyric acid synthase CobQ n=1 Tax=Hymenobacter telluris TaxID=2816474 RepID=A0A939JBE2_9BACT|nr:cobyric acid synthase CobQ [Hymenobacter telluris]MBO0360834.1 cobyric acid synthase CobQ [Hymenobacter telluris]MBW3376863.1 cobyric acid synthase CobQ [Hymenobacter norwichensis]